MNNPNVIILSGRREEEIINYLPAIEDGVIKAGHLIEQAKDNTLGLGWQRNSSATGMPDLFVALPMDIAAKGLDDTYAKGDNLVAHPLRAGMTWWGLVPSGQTVTAGSKYQSNGDGTLKAVADAAVARFKAQETLGAVNVLTRARFLVVW